MLNTIENLFNTNNPNHSFIDICTIESLYAAWRKVRANRGACGIDTVSIKDFEKNLQNNLTELSRNLLSRTYQPLPVKFVRVMKANGKLRELGILTIRDRVAQRAVLDRIGPDFELLMKDCSYAFRQGRNLEMAIQQILVSRANGFWWTVEADISDYFGSINREIMLEDVAQVVSDKNTLDLIELWLNAGVLEETWWQTGGKKIAQVNRVAYEAVVESLDNAVRQRYGTADDFGSFPVDFEESAEISPLEKDELKNQERNTALKGLLKDGFWLAMSNRELIGKVLGAKVLGIGGLAIAGITITPALVELFRQRFHPRKGILQGSPISPVLANLYLTDFDVKIIGSGSHLVRYCDDFVILCRSEAEARAALQKAEKELGKRCLKLHPEKTRILSPTDSFEFLGYRFLSNGTIEPPPTATNAMANKLKQLSKKVSRKFQRKKKFNIEKKTVKSWKEFFDIFGKGK